MNRLLFFVAFLFPLFAQSQAKTYSTIRAVDFNFSHGDPCFGGLFSVGALDKNAGGGIGIGAVKISGGGAAYIPVFGEVIAYTNPAHTGLFFNGQVGYGIYHQDLAGASESGGLYLHPNIGLYLPMGAHSAILITGGYISSGFKIKSNSRYLSDQTTTSHGFSLSLGAKL